MNKIALFCLLMLILPSLASAELLPNNVNTTEEYYTNNTVSLNYSLNISDSVSYVEYQFTLSKNKFPYNITTSFRDSKNNIIKTKESFAWISGIPFSSVRRQTTLSFNDVTILPAEANNYSDYVQYNPYEASSFIAIRYRISTRAVIGEISIFRDRYNLPRDVFINQINLSKISGLEYKRIEIKYLDNGVAIVKSGLNAAFDSYNPVFKLIYMFVEGALGVYNLLTGGNEATLLEFKSSFIGEGSILFYLNLMINFIFTMVKWITTMGLMWTFSIVSMVIFIYSYIQSKNNMLLTFKRFVEYEMDFIKIALIRPITWMYEKIVLFWTGK